MAIAAGTRVGPYEIVSPLGAGGMGEVYRARDTRLKRDVALKILPESFATDADRLARFQREAEVLASLSHPHIAGIYGVEERDGVRALALELVDGETLADRIARGAVPLDEALPIARQIADALEAAHEQGVVHRDLKPANIKITPGGVVKVLDFGLAKLIESSVAASGASASLSPTITSPALMTGVGVLLGTAAYMSPEQARGKTVDKRADIWAFGAVLYELLTGRRPFEGDDVGETLAKVIQSEPRWDDVPARAQRVLKKCLEKDPKKRLRDIGDAWQLLDEEASAHAAAAKASTLPWALAGVLAVAASIAGVMLWRATRPVDHPLEQYEVDLGSNVTLPPPGSSPSVVMSPDGRYLAYVATVSGDTTRLFVRRLDQQQATELAGTDGASAPFFSLDSQRIAFVASTGGGAKFYVVSVEDGAVVSIGEASNFAGAAWLDAEHLIEGTAVVGGLLRIPVNGGTPEVLLPLGNDFVYRHPFVLPSGNAVLLAREQPASIDVEVFSLSSRERKLLVRGASMPKYLPSGHLLYVSQGTLFAVPFDPVRLETHGTAVPILNGIASRNSGADFDVSAGSALVYRKGGITDRDDRRAIEFIDGAGRHTPVTRPPDDYYMPTFSPDGTRIAMAIFEGQRQGLYVYDIAQNLPSKLTSGFWTSLVWTPDGKNVILGSVAGGIFWMRSDGSNQPQPLIVEGGDKHRLSMVFSMSRDGKLVYSAAEKSGDDRNQLWVLPVRVNGGSLSAGTPQSLLPPTTSVVSPTISPNEKWIAYSSDESGKTQIYVRPFSPSSSQSSRATISDSGRRPVWSRTGNELFYQDGQDIIAVSYTSDGDTFILGQRRRVWLSKLGEGNVNWDLDPTRDRIVVIRPVAAAPAPPKQEHTVTILKNFLDESPSPRSGELTFQIPRSSVD